MTYRLRRRLRFGCVVGAGGDGFSNDSANTAVATIAAVKATPTQSRRSDASGAC